MTWTIEELSEADIAALRDMPACCQSMRNTGGLGDVDAVIGLSEDDAARMLGGA